MSLRGRINQGVTDWRDQRVTTRKPFKKDTETVAAFMQIWGKSGVDVMQEMDTQKPDTRDGVDLFVIIVFIWSVCLIAGYVIGRNT